MMKLSILLLVVASLSYSQAGQPIYLDGKLAESKSLPLRVACPAPYAYIYLGGITFNETGVDESLRTVAQNDCDKQLKKQEGKGGAYVACYLTFGKHFDTGDTGTVRAVFKCMTTKPAKAPGGKDWEKGHARGTMQARPDGKNKITFRCPGVNEIVELQKIFQEEEEITSGLDKKREYYRTECYRQTVSKIEKGEKGAMTCEIQLAAEEAAETVMYYKCVEPPINIIEEPSIIV